MTSELIAKSIVDLPTTFKGNSLDLSVSNIIVRTDDTEATTRGVL